MTKDNNNNNKQDNKKQQKDSTIQQLAKSNDLDSLRKQLDEACIEKNNIIEQEAVPNSRQRSLVHQLETDVSKYKGAEKKLEDERAKLEKSQKETKDKLDKVDEKINNLNLAIKVRKSVDFDLPTRKSMAEDSKKAAEEGAKPFTPMITPDQAYDISGVTESIKSEKGKVPKHPNDDKQDEEE